MNRRLNNRRLNNLILVIFIAALTALFIGIQIARYQSFFRLHPEATFMDYILQSK